MAGRDRPVFEPTDDQRKNVEIMVGLGIKQDDICLMVRDAKDKPISLKTLLKHFRKELDQGAAKLNGRIGNFMVATILGTHPEDGTTPITNQHARASLAAVRQVTDGLALSAMPLIDVGKGRGYRLADRGRART